MKRTSNKLGSIVLSLCEVVVGVLLLVNPVGFTKGILIALGCLLLILGLINIVRYFRTDPVEAAVKQELTRGCLAILAGLFCITQSGWFLAAFPLLTMLYGILILITGVGKVQWTVDRIRLHMRRWGWTAVSAVLTIGCAAVILCNPFATTEVLWGFIGVMLIVEAVADVLAAILTREVL